jgi:hypothetical protein
MPTSFVTSLEATSTADWITALATAVLAIVGSGLTVWQMWLGGFHPKCEAFLDVKKEAIMIRIVNSGRGQGTISQVVVVTSDGRGIEDAIVEETGAELPPTPVVGGQRIEAILTRSDKAIARPDASAENPDNGGFRPTDKVKVTWGKKSKTLDLKQVEVGLSGMPSVLR